MVSRPPLPATTVQQQILDFAGALHDLDGLAPERQGTTRALEEAIARMLDIHIQVANTRLVLNDLQNYYQWGPEAVNDPDPLHFLLWMHIRVLARDRIRLMEEALPHLERHQLWMQDVEASVNRLRATYHELLHPLEAAPTVSRNQSRPMGSSRRADTIRLVICSSSADK